MTVIVGPHEASPELLAPLSDLISRRAPINHRVRRIKEEYIISHVQKSESAWILFTHSEKQDAERYVIKLLCRYNDQRYHLEKLWRRQQCQVEALTCNTTFSPNIYIGLANAYQLQTQKALLIISPPTHTIADLNPYTEYALVMRQLPSQGRLDLLLRDENEYALQQHLYHIVKRIVDIHTASPALFNEEERRWGGFQNLKSKLEHNLSLADPLFKGWYPAIRNDDLANLQQRFAYLRTNLEQIFDRHPYAEYFERRMNQHHIKHCHGDLKGPNIWIDDATEDHRVAILDAIDFNPMYSNIDTLSDFATLVIDVQTRLHCSAFAQTLTRQMITQYLVATGQDQDEVAHAVLHYYLIEKAFVGAAISIIYDDLLELGMDFLRAAETCWHNYFMRSIRSPLPELPPQSQKAASPLLLR